MSARDMQLIYETIFDLSYNAGHYMRQMGDSKSASDLMDMVGGSRELKDRIVAWAMEFDDEWFKRPEGEREDYLAEVDDFFNKKWSALMKELDRFNAEDGTMSEPQVVSVQIVPVVDTGSEVGTQFDGPDERTTGWGIYYRHDDGTVAHVADVTYPDGYDIAMLMGRALAIEGLVPVEPQPWVKPPEVVKLATPERFHITWTLDVDAHNARQAAEKALAMQRNPESIATVFDVRDDHSDVAVRIDLSEGTDAES